MRFMLICSKIENKTYLEKSQTAKTKQKNLNLPTREPSICLARILRALYRKKLSVICQFIIAETHARILKDTKELINCRCHANDLCLTYGSTRLHHLPVWMWVHMTVSKSEPDKAVRIHRDYLCLCWQSKQVSGMIMC